mmetsp:Transcript_71226/g.126882  ORF Transcript_71226/g.126882 Transcript_71226/m.126882 type:complete len:133 (-) Transcript_71226:116-514(-)
MNGDVRPRFCTFLPTATTSVMLLIATATLVGGQEAEEEEEEMTDWRSWPGGGALAARLAAEEGMDWRHLDGHLPFQWKYVHPTKRCAYQDLGLGRLKRCAVQGLPGPSLPHDGRATGAGVGDSLVGSRSKTA